MMISLVPSSETGSRKLQKIYLDHTFLRLPVAPLVNFLLQKMRWAYKVLIGLLLEFTHESLEAMEVHAPNTHENPVSLAAPRLPGWVCSALK